MEIITKIHNMKDTHTHNDIYKLLIKNYPKQILDFYIYELLKYRHDTTNEELTRNNQQKFRNNLIKRYGECVITGADSEVCDACHIVPYKDCSDYDRYNINNGLLFRSDLHKLFDNGKMKIDPDTRRIIMDPTILSNDKMYDIHKYNGKEISIGKKTLYYVKKRLMNYNS